MEDPAREEEHHHYWPDNLVTISPQARRFGYTMPVYVTPAVWRSQCVWGGPSKFKTNPDKRIFELLNACFGGMNKALAVSDERVAFTFKHWYWPSKVKPTARKQAKAKLGARLFLHPETDEPWLLIFDTALDKITDLKAGDKPE